MRLSLLAVTAVLVWASTACGDRPSPVEPVGSALPRAVMAQGRPTEVDQTPFEIPAGVFCDFAFRVEPSGRAKTIELPGQRTIFLSPGLAWAFTNLDTGKRETFRIPGAFHQTILENGDVETVVTGRSILGDPIAGLVLAIGRFSFVFDAQGNLIQPLQGTGRLIDICEVLA
jgi:hypothetical protein